MNQQPFSLRDFRTHKWAIFYCAVSTIGALCYGYDQTYYTGVQGMTPFVNEFAATTDASGKPALTASFLSLTTSMIYLGEAVGALVCAPINDRLGRKAVFNFASLCIMAGATAQLVARGSEAVLVVARLLVGAGIGQMVATCLLYMGEVAPLRIRGPALMCFQLTQSCSQLVGSVVTQATSAIPDRRCFVIPFASLYILPGLMLLLCPLIPESPAWYVSRGLPDCAAVALHRINRGVEAYDPAPDVRALEELHERETAMRAGGSWVSLLTDRTERRRMVFSCGAMFTQQINGILFFYSYGVVFAQSIGIKQAFTIAVITNTLQVVSVAVSVALGNRVPRRTNMWVSTWVMWAAFVVVGGLGTTRSESEADGGGFASSTSAAIVVFSYVVIVSFNFSLGPLAFTVASEMAVGRNRNKIVSCSMILFFFTCWLTSFTAPYLYYSADLGPKVGFVYAATTCITLVYVWFCVGETKGRSYLEIERFLSEQIPVRKWTSHVFDSPLDLAGAEAEKGPDVVQIESA